MQFDLIIIGAGVCGLSCAYAIQQSNPSLSILILEKETAPGSAQSGRNSGVLHAGHLYRPGTLMAELCVKGNSIAQQFCTTHNIPFKRTGKLTVATTNEECTTLNTLLSHAQKNGVEARIISSEESITLEPHISCKQSLYTPSTAIIDLDTFVKVLTSEVEALGVTIRVNEEATSIVCSQNGHTITSTETEYACRVIINAAGVHADTIGIMINPSFSHSIQPMRGEYMYLNTTRDEVSLQGHNVYPVPQKLPGVYDQQGKAQHTVGVHLTPQFVHGKEMDSRVLVGPFPTPTQSRENKLTPKIPAATFVQHLRPFLPAVQESDLTPAFVGLQTKIKDFDDFVIEVDSSFSSVIHVLAPSPGLTACLAIGDYVHELYNKL